MLQRENRPIARNFPVGRIKKSPMRKFFLPEGGTISIIRTAMKQITALLTIFAMFTSHASAWVGGPYSNNTFDGFDGGIFQYTFRGNNVTGLARFTQNTSSSYNSEFGDSVTYYNGVAYYGESYGFVDFSSGVVDGITNDVIAELSRFRQFLVIAASSTFTYKGKAVDARQAPPMTG